MYYVTIFKWIFSFSSSGWINITTWNCSKSFMEKNVRYFLIFVNNFFFTPLSKLKIPSCFYVLVYFNEWLFYSIINTIVGTSSRKQYVQSGQFPCFLIGLKMTSEWPWPFPSTSQQQQPHTLGHSNFIGEICKKTKVGIVSTFY